LRYTDNEEINTFLSENNFGWFLGVLFDKGQISERAWEFPYKLFNRIGKEKFSPGGISDFSLFRLDEIFLSIENGLRFPLIASAAALRAAYKIKNQYNGLVENLWASVTRPKELQKNFEDSHDIGQKKASMAVNILIANGKVQFEESELTETQLSNDKHVTRVLSRLGFEEISSSKGRSVIRALIEAGKLLNRPNPGAMDLPLWHIGRNYCFNTKPQCRECPLNDACAKKIKNK